MGLKAHKHLWERFQKYMWEMGKGIKKLVGRGKEVGEGVPTLILCYCLTYVFNYRQIYRKHSGKR